MATTGIAAVPLVLSLMALSASFVATIIMTILVTREMESLDTWPDGTEA
jgi:hypothetical protein